MTAYVSAHMENVHMKATASGKSATAADARRGLLHEGARSLVGAWEQKWADKNPNIRPGEAHRNVVLVQAPGDDGSYDLREATTKQEADAFIKYGNERTALLEHPPRAGYVAFSSMAFHYPKDFCDEHPAEAQAVDQKTGEKIFDKNGEPVMVARYTPKNYDEMRRYFDDALDQLSDSLGGREHVHGVFIHLDERTPHMQVVFDSYQPSDNDPDKLKAGHSLLWGTHEDVCYPKGTMVRGKDMSGKRISGSHKMTTFQKDLREHMAECGWDVSVKRSARHKDHYTKEEYAEIENARAAKAQESAALDKKREDYEADVADYEVSLSALDEREDEVQEREDELDKRERKINEQENNIALRLAALEKREEELDEREAAIKTDEELMAASVKKIDDLTQQIEKETFEKANGVYADLIEAAKQDANAVVQDAENKRDDVYAEARQQAHNDVVTSLNKQISAANKAKTDADQYSKQRREDADAYYTSRTSTAREEKKTLDGEKATLERDNRTLREDKATLTREKDSLKVTVDAYKESKRIEKRELEQLRQEKKELSLGDLVAQPDSVKPKLEKLRTVVSQNVLHLRGNGMTGQAVNDVINALGDVVEDERFKRLVRDHDGQQGGHDGPK